MDTLPNDILQLFPELLRASAQLHQRLITAAYSDLLDVFNACDKNVSALSLHGIFAVIEQRSDNRHKLVHIAIASNRILFTEYIKYRRRPLRYVMLGDINVIKYMLAASYRSTDGRFKNLCYNAIRYNRVDAIGVIYKCYYSYIPDTMTLAAIQAYANADTITFIITHTRMRLNALPINLALIEHGRVEQYCGVAWPDGMFHFGNIVPLCSAAGNSGNDTLIEFLLHRFSSMYRILQLQSIFCSACSGGHFDIAVKYARELPMDYVVERILRLTTPLATPFDAFEMLKKLPATLQHLIDANASEWILTRARTEL